MLIVLARLLTPHDFGIMGIALLLLGAMKQFTQIGLDAALIHDVADDVDEYLDTVWVLEIARGLLIAGCLFVGAPYSAGFFGEPGAAPILQVIALVPLIEAVRNPGVVYFKKDLAFHKDFLYRGFGGIVQFVVGVGYALMSPTVWALVFAYIASELVKMLLSYVLHGYRPWFTFDIAAARKLIHYGKWITGSSVIHFLYSQGDDAFVGWYLSAAALGIYQYAYRLADTPSTEVSEVVAQVVFPTFSKLQHDTAQLREAFLQSTRFVAFITFPMAFGMVLVAPTFVPVVLGDDWLAMIPIFQILAIYGLVHAITRNFGSLWKAVGRPDLTMKMPAIGVVVIALVIWPATAQWGVVGTALAVVFVSVGIVFPLNVYVSTSMIEAHPLAIYREYAYPCLASLVMVGTLWTATEYISLPPAVELLLLIPAGALVYVCTAFVLERQFAWGIEANLRLIVNRVVG